MYERARDHGQSALSAMGLHEDVDVLAGDPTTR